MGESASLTDGGIILPISDVHINCVSDEFIRACRYTDTIRYIMAPLELDPSYPYGIQHRLNLT